MEIIKDTDTLARFCHHAATADFVTVDTEFMRETTYWPILCLLQMATKDQAVLVDPQTDNLSLDPVVELFDNNDVVKVFHAAKQDIEIFVKLSGRAPTPVFDTQVAASVCGFGDSIAYDGLVREVTGETIDKTSRFTDWSRRPLSEKQLEYALGDVTHLRSVYHHLTQKLTELGRTNWVADELRELSVPDNYIVQPEHAWRRLKMKVNRPLDYAIMQKVAAWRERRAQSTNVPRARVMKDDAIFEIALQHPRDAAGFERLRSFSRGFGRSGAAGELIEIVTSTMALDKSALPKVPRQPRGPSAKGPVGDLLRVLLKAVAESNGVASRVIATSAEIDAIVRDDHARVPALAGWRRQLFGDLALKIKHGRLALGANGEGIVPIEIEALEPGAKLS